MKLIQLEYFREVCRCGSVTRAAEHLRVSQPSVSMAIRELEEQFGVSLFYRRNRRLILTKEGEFFLERAEELLDRADALERQMKELGSESDPVKIGVSPMISVFLFSRMFNEFHALHPDTRLELCEYGSLESERLLLEDRLDMAMVILHDRTGDHFHSLEILKTPLVYCVRPGHPMAGLSKVSIPMLKDEQLILMKSSSYQTGAVIDRRFQEAGLRPKVLLHSSQLYISKQYILEQGAGAFLMEEMVRLEPELVGIPLDPPIELRVGLIWKKGKYLDSGASKFLEFATQYRHPRPAASNPS